MDSLAFILHPILQDPHTCGEIVLGSSNDGYSVSEDVPTRLAGMYCFMLHVPNRANGGYPLQANSEESKQQWMTSLKYVIAETTDITPDHSVATTTYNADDDLYATIGDFKI